MSCAMVAGIDEGFGKIIDVLRESGELDNTIIAFSTDNGGVPYAGALNYPLKGGKSTMWEGGVRAPGFIYAPKQLGKGYDFQGLFPTKISLYWRLRMRYGTSVQRTLPRNDFEGCFQLKFSLYQRPRTRSVGVSPQRANSRNQNFAVPASTYAVRN